MQCSAIHHHIQEGADSDDLASKEASVNISDTDSTQATVPGDRVDANDSVSLKIFRERLAGF